MLPQNASRQLSSLLCYQGSTSSRAVNAKMATARASLQTPTGDVTDTTSKQQPTIAQTNIHNNNTSNQNQ